MSNISDAYDQLYTDLAALYPTKLELSDSSDIIQNTDEAKANGYGVALGPGVNTNRQLACSMSIGRTITIVLTKKVYATDLQPEEIRAKKKELLEEHFLLLKKYEDENELGLNIAHFNFQSDSGMQNIFEDQNKYIKIESVFTLEYFEKLT